MAALHSNRSEGLQGLMGREVREQYGPVAYFGEADHSFRTNAIRRFGPRRLVVSVHADHGMSSGHRIGSSAWGAGGLVVGASRRSEPPVSVSRCARCTSRSRMVSLGATVRFALPIAQTHATADGDSQGA